MIYLSKPQSGFAHPFVTILIVGILSIVGVIGWRVHAFAKHAQAQEAALTSDMQQKPSNAERVLYGIPLSTAKASPSDLSAEMPEISKLVVPFDLDAPETVHHFFEALRQKHYYDSLHFVSHDFVAELHKKAKTDSIETIVGMCRIDRKCKSLIATQSLNPNFEQREYRSKNGLSGIQLSYDLKEANPSASKFYPERTKLTFGLLPYINHGHSYWAIDHIEVGTFRIN